MPRAPVTLLGSGPHTSAAVLWRMQGTLHVTVVVKATFALVHEGPARLVAAREITFSERAAGGLEGRSLEAASDLAPHKSRTDVTFVGDAYPPGGAPAPALAVRLAVYRDKALLDKTLRVYGDRSGDRPAPEPFRAMPLAYERAYGGPTFPANPVGIGADARVRTAPGAPSAPEAGSALPNVVDPTDPTKPAGFGPLSERWTARRRILGTLDPAILEAPIATVPSPQIFAYFQSAPADQQIEYLRGDEWLVLDHLHPTLPRVSSRLPGVRGACQIYLPDATGRYPAGRPLPMRLDTLAIDGREQVFSLVFRTNFPLLGGEKALEGVRVACGLEGAGLSLSWPDPATLSADAAPPVAPVAPATPSPAAAPPAASRAPAAPAAPAAPPAKKLLEGTAALSDEQQAWLAQQRTAPFAGKKAEPPPPPAPPTRGKQLTGTATLSEEDLAEVLAAKPVPFADRPPDVPAPAAPRVPVATPPLPAPPNPPTPAAPRMPVTTPPVVARQNMPAPAAPPAAPPPRAPVSTPPLATPPGARPPAKPLERTSALGDDVLRELRKVREGETVLPFSKGAAPPEIAASTQRPAAPRSSPLTGTAALSDADLLALTRVDPLPFALPPAPGKGTPTATRSLERKVPRRRTPALPTATDVPLAVATMAWQVRPPKDSVTVVVKGTFDLVEGGPATFRAEPAPILGDVYAGDDPEKGLVYASDLTVFKPRCDVTVVGHAHAPRGSATHALVGFRLGEGPKKIDRSLNVLGDRTWKKALGVALAPTDPAPFDRIPLVYERAFGGPDHPANPLGVGHKSTQESDGTLRLPNLEDPNRPVRTPADAPPPACFAPVSPGWQQRSKNLGTYDKRWLATRWPYFPEDFDWRSAQHAPESQQTDEIAPDAPYEMRGLAPSGGTLRGRLPGIQPRCFVERSTDDGEGGGGFHELPLKLDTAHFDLDENKLVLVWRALLEVTDEDAPEVAVLFVTTDPLSGPPLTLEQARERMLDATALAFEAGESPDDSAPANDVSDPARELPAPLTDPALRARVMAALDAGEDLSAVDLSDVDLSDLDFEGRSLRGAVFLRSSLRRCNFTGADLTGAQLGGADLTDARLSGATLDGADFHDARLERASLEGASLHGASFSGAAGRSAVLRGARGAHVVFVAGDWTGAVFDEADLPAADLSSATLDDTSFVRARLPQVRLLDAKGEDARFDGAHLPGARANGVTLIRCSLRSIEAPGSVWDSAALEGTSFQGAVLTGAGFTSVKAQGADFGGADAADARFRKAGLRGARLLGANLMKATFERADLQDADLRGANLHEAETWKAKLKGAQLDLAIVTRSKLAGKKA